MATQGENLLPCPPRPLVMDGRWKPNIELAPNCPRCDSSNTKFCYYNNYSLTQPRYFCKNCRRYWTKGGSLRNVPVGGGCRKSCRKSRRGKSGRISTNRISTGYSTNGAELPGFDCSRLPLDGPIGNSYASNGIPMVPPTRSDASTIDLALVYAKFLNQGSDSDPRLVMPGLHRELNATFNLPNISEANHDPHVQFSHEHGLVGGQGPSNQSTETWLSEVHQVLLGEFDMNHKQQEQVPQLTSLDTNCYGLQPLPAEEVVNQDMFWSNPPLMSSNFTWQETQLQRFEPLPETLHSNPLYGNWSSFDLPGYEVFSRP